MPWFRVDVDFFRHPKVVDRSKDAKLLFLAALALCAEQGTDGILSPAMVRIVAAMVDVKPTVAQDLVAAGLWHPVTGPGVVEGSYVVHDYLDKQEPAARRRASRDASKERMQAMRERRRDGERSPPRYGVTNGATPAATTGVSDAACSPEVRPTTRTQEISLSPALNHQVSRAGESGLSAAEKEMDQGKPQASEAVAARWLDLFPRQRREAAAQLGAVLVHLDERLVDEIIGHCVAMEPPPTSPRYLRTISADWARQRGIGLSIEALADLAGKSA